MSDVIEIFNLRVQLASAYGDGMHVELAAESDHKQLNDGSLNPLLWFRADSEDEVKVVLESKNGLVTFPVAELQKAIDTARTEVHCESHYDEADNDT